MFVIKDINGEEFFTGIIRATSKNLKWEPVFSPDFQRALVFSSAQEAITIFERYAKDHGFDNGFVYRVIEVDQKPFHVSLPSPSELGFDFSEPTRYTAPENLIPRYQRNYSFPTNIEFKGCDIQYEKPTISQICKSADDHKDNYYALTNLLQTANFHKSTFTNSEFSFIAEHIKGYIEEIQAKEKMKGMLGE